MLTLKCASALPLYCATYSKTIARQSHATRAKVRTHSCAHPLTEAVHVNMALCAFLFVLGN